MSDWLLFGRFCLVEREPEEPRDIPLERIRAAAQPVRRTGPVGAALSKTC